MSPHILLLLRVAVIIVLAVNAIFTMIMLGHSIFVYNYFHGAPPTEDFQIGQVILTVALVIAFLTLIYALFVKLFDFKSFVIVITIDVGFVIAIALSIIAVYFFRNTRPSADEFQSYVKSYFKENQAPPQFFNKIQHQMQGYCCGSSSYQDYVEGHDDFFNIPHSCCFLKQRLTNPQCGTREWKYLYLFLESNMREILTTLETKYVDTEDLQAVLLQVMPARSEAFVSANYQSMLHDREASMKNISSPIYVQIQKEQQALNPYLDAKQIAEAISRRISIIASADLQELLKQLNDVKAVMFLPMGCFDFMEELKTSKWKGFNEFRLVRKRVISTFEGLLGMIICNIVLLIIAAAFFNLNKQGIDVSEHRLTAIMALQKNHDEDEVEESVAVPNETTSNPFPVDPSDTEEEELQSFIESSKKIDIQS